MTEQSTETPVLTLSSEDHRAILQVCLDYVDGWYTADPDRMARALHPELVKRTVKKDESGDWIVGPTTTAETMVGYTRDGGGSDVPRQECSYDIRIVDIFQHIAMVKALSPLFMDYLQLAKFDDQWLIVNVLWEKWDKSLDEEASE